MHNLFEHVPQHFDPYSYAKGHQVNAFQLPLSQTQELKNWQSKSEAITANLKGRIDELRQFRLAGNVAITLITNCQRCLEAMEIDINQNFDYVLINNVSQENNVRDGEESLICEKNELDLAWFLEEEVLLAIPMIAKHEHCQMPQISTMPTAEIEEENPFAALKNAFKKEQNPHGSSTKS